MGKKRSVSRRDLEQYRPRTAENAIDWVSACNWCPPDSVIGAQSGITTMSSMVVSFMAGGEVVHHDDRLIDLLGKGWAAWEQLSNGIRIEDPTRRSHLCRLARLGFLAPDIVTAILAGTQPVELTARSLLRANDLTVSWPDQRRLLGVELPQPGAKHRRIGEQDTNQPL